MVVGEGSVFLRSTGPTTRTLTAPLAVTAETQKGKKGHKNIPQTARKYQV